MAYVPLPTPSITEIVRGSKKIHDWFQQTEWQTAAVEMKSALTDPGLCEFLQWRYRKHKLLEFGGRIYPTFVIPAPKIQIADPESVLGSLDASEETTWQTQKWDDLLWKAGERFRRLQEKVGVYLYDSPVYSLKEFKQEPDGRIRLSCQIGSYYGFLNTGNILGIELLTRFAEERPKPSDFEKFDRRLPLRRRADALGSIYRPEGRCCALGISTVLLYPDGKEQHTLAWERSYRVAVDPGLRGVVPAGNFASVFDDHDVEFSVRHNFYREFAEEIFGKPERQTGGHQMDSRNQDLDPDIRYLESLESQGQARLYLTGVAFSLLSLSLEICTVMEITTPDWKKQYGPGGLVSGLSPFKSNLEFLSTEELRSQGKSTRTKHEFSQVLSSPGEIVPSSAAALSLAAAWAK
jgi:hypothetical protein